MVELIVFVACAAVVLGGGLGVVLSRNPVHSALSLVATLFGIAVLFVELEAHLLAAVQVIVYAGAIVILFLFVIMLLGIDEADDLEVEPIAGQRPLAVATGVGLLGAGLLVFVLSGQAAVTGQRAAVGAITDEVPNVEAVGELLFTDYIAAFEITGVLLTVAVVAAVVMVRRRPTDVELDDEPPSALELGEQRRREQAEADASDDETDDETDQATDEPDDEKAEVD